MRTILIVDDSAQDRLVMQELLGNRPSERVLVAADGREALEVLAQRTVAVVLADIFMPRMDGLGLVERVARDHPGVPVILVTSQGNEELAARALTQGAASYVPKQFLAKSLRDTVDRVLQLSEAERADRGLRRRMTRSRATFVLENDLGLIAPLVRFFQAEVTLMDLCPDGEVTRVGVALEEAVANAMTHGNLEVASTVRLDSPERFRDLINSRQRQAPYKDRRVFVETDLAPERAVFVVRDEGPGFDVSLLPDPTDAANITKPFGRGVLLMRTFMDEVSYNQRGNQVRMTKRCPAAA